MKRRTTRFMAMLLTVAMVFGCNGSIVFALENTYGIESESEENLIGNDEITETEEVNPEDTVLEKTETDCTAADELFYRDLTADEEEAKDAASADENEVMDAEEGEDYLANEVIALCDSEDEAEEIAEAYAKSTGYTVKVDSFSYGVAVLKMYGRPDQEKIEEYIDEYDGDTLNSVETFVKLGADTDNNLPAVYPNYRRYAQSIDTSREDGFSDPMLQTGSEEYAGMYQWYHDYINDKYVWKLIDKADSDLGHSLEEIHVAVLDSGINFDHSDLSDVVTSHDNFMINEPQYDDYGGVSIDESTDREKDGEDTNGHGTNVAGIIGNIANSIGGRGVAAGVKIDSYRVLGRYGSSSDGSIIQGLNKAIADKESGAKNIRVINMSLGGANYSGAYAGPEGPLQKAAENKILIVASAGNGSADTYNYPASFDSVMSVAALNSNYEKSGFSNYGAWVDIAAPGGEGRLDYSSPEYVREPLWASGKSELEGSGMRKVLGENYSAMNGTSQATPIVSACAAILFASNPGYSAEDVEGILESTARPLKSKYQIGAGCVDVAAALQIDTEVPKPSADVLPGKIDSGDVIELSLPEGYEYSDRASIYYTLNGKIPFDAKTNDADVFKYDPDQKITLTGAGKASICAQTALYGNVSDSVTFNYTFNDSGVDGITVYAPGNIRADADANGTAISPEGAVAEVGLGKAVRCTASVFPAYAKNKKIKWSSDNTDIATVDANGNVKGINIGRADIKAESTDGIICAVIPFEVKTASEQVEIKSEGIDLCVDKTGKKSKHSFDDNEIMVYPLSASQRVTLKSSNTRIAVIKYGADNKQYIEAVSPGDAVITATAADGSNISDSVPIHVSSKIRKIRISDATGNNIILRGYDYTPTVVINDGEEVISGDGDIKWKVVDPANASVYLESNGKNVKINNGYGNVSATVTIQAYAGTGDDLVESNTLALTLYDRTSYVTDSDRAKHYENNGWGYSDWWFYKDVMNNVSGLFEVYPSTACQKLRYTCKSTDASINQETGAIIFKKNGWISIKAETIDGSKKSKEIKVRVDNREDGANLKGIRCKSGNTVLYPGKSIEFEPLLTEKTALSSGYKLGILGERINEWAEEYEEDGYTYTYDYYNYLQQNEYVSVAKNKVTAKKLTGVKPGDRQLVFFGYVNEWINIYCFEPELPYYTASIELYPSATKSLELRLKNGANTTGVFNGQKHVMNVNDQVRIIPSSLPADACQQYYTFKSGNTKIVTVDSTGNVRAVGNGKTSVTVIAGDGSGKNAKIDFEVARVATGITIGSKTNTFSVIPGKTLNLTASVLPADTVNKKIVWSITSGSDYAKINAGNGTVTGIAPGEVVVKALNEASGVAKTQNITVLPATGSITVDDQDISKNGLTLYTQSKGTCSNSSTFDFTVVSQTPGQAALKPAVTSANVNIAEVEAVGDPTVNGNTSKFTYRVIGKGSKSGNTNINIAAADGSGKKLSVKVKVLIPVTEINVTTPGGASTVTPGKSLKLTAATNKDASNKNVVWKFSDGTEKAKADTLGIDTAAFEKNGTVSMKKNSTGNGFFSVVAVAADGSGTSSPVIKIFARPQLVTSVTIKDKTGVNPVKSTALGTYAKAGDLARTDDFAIKKEFRIDIASVTGNVIAPDGDFQTLPVVTSGNEAIARAKIDPADYSKLYVYTYDATERYKATKTGSTNITVKATDGSNKSVTLQVKVAEPVRIIYLSADKTSRNIAANGKITMKAAVNGNATNKKIIWSLKKTDGTVIDPKDGTIAKISTSGAITPNKDLLAKTTVKAVATASDGSGISAEESITLYPAQGAITFRDGANAIGTAGLNLSPGQSKEITVNGTANAYKDYLVTYSTGVVKVQYVLKGAEGTSVKITALKKGTSNVKATALDGSGKNATLKITVK